MLLIWKVKHVRIQSGEKIGVGGEKGTVFICRNPRDGWGIQCGKHKTMETWRPVSWDSCVNCLDPLQEDVGSCTAECILIYVHNLTLNGLQLNSKWEFDHFLTEYLVLTWFPRRMAQIDCYSLWKVFSLNHDLPLASRVSGITGSDKSELRITDLLAFIGVRFPTPGPCLSPNRWSVCVKSY